MFSLAGWVLQKEKEKEKENITQGQKGKQKVIFKEEESTSERRKSQEWLCKVEREGNQKENHDVAEKGRLTKQDLDG